MQNVGTARGARKINQLTKFNPISYIMYNKISVCYSVCCHTSLYSYKVS